MGEGWGVSLPEGWHTGSLVLVCSVTVDLEAGVLGLEFLLGRYMMTVVDFELWQ